VALEQSLLSEIDLFKGAVCNDNKAKRRSAFPAVWLHDMYARGGSRKKILGEGAGPSSFGRQQRLSEINIEPIASTSSRTTLSNCPVLIWGHGQDLGGLCPLPQHRTATDVRMRGTGVVRCPAIV